MTGIRLLSTAIVAFSVLSYGARSAERAPVTVAAGAPLTPDQETLIRHGEHVVTAEIAAAVIKQVRSAFMKKNYIDITKRISGDLRKLRQDIPDTMKAFSALAQAAGRDGALDKKTKELIALAIAIATRCDGCIGFHMEALVRLGATRQEVEETLGMTIYMGGGPSLMYAADAISAFEEFQVQLGVAA